MQGEVCLIQEDNPQPYALGDSGSSQVMLDWKELPANEDPNDLFGINVHLAAGSLKAKVWREEIYAEGVTKPLCPMGRVVQRLSLQLKWTKGECLLGCLVGKQTTHVCPLMKLVVRKDLPYFTKKQFSLVRRALWDHFAGRRIVDATYWKKSISHPRAQPDVYQAAAMECFDKDVTSIYLAAGGVIDAVKLEQQK